MQTFCLFIFLGISNTCTFMLDPVKTLYTRVNSLLESSCGQNIVDDPIECDYDDEDTDDEKCFYAVELLYEKSFLIQLCVRFGMDSFLENFPHLVIGCLTTARNKRGEWSQYQSNSTLVDDLRKNMSVLNASKKFTEVRKYPRVAMRQTVGQSRIKPGANLWCIAGSFFRSWTETLLK